MPGPFEGRMSRYIRHRRGELQLTHQQLADLIEVSPSFIRLVESGHRRLALDRVAQLADALQTNPTYFGWMAALEGKPDLFQNLWRTDSRGNSQCHCQKRRPGMSPQSSKILGTPEQLYEYLLVFWQIYLSVEENDLAQLRELHRALCNQEMLLCDRHLERCMQNLAQRLHDARSLGMQLSIPSWVAIQLEDLEQRSEEEGLPREVQP